jgi:hypothetical protein
VNVDLTCQWQFRFHRKCLLSKVQIVTVIFSFPNVARACGGDKMDVAYFTAETRDTVACERLHSVRRERSRR